MAFRCERWTLANILPITFVLWVIGTIWSLYCWLHLLPLLQFGSAQGDRDEGMRLRGQVEFVVAQSLAVLLLTCFTRAVLTDPGSVPETAEWSPDAGSGTQRWPRTAPPELVPEPLAAGEELKAACLETKQSGQRRFCKWCDSYKPDRCHHCRICKSCILRMDHHCPWIANCVGFGNHKYFFLLVFYALLNLGFIISTMSESMLKALSEETPPMHRFLLVFCMTLACLMGLLLKVFFGMHVWLMLHATTTIEWCEKRHKRGTFELTYDQGVYRNICAVLGPMPILWLLPLRPPEGKGLSFPSRRDDAAPEPAAVDSAGTAD